VAPSPLATPGLLGGDRPPAGVICEILLLDFFFLSSFTSSYSSKSAILKDILLSFCVSILVFVSRHRALKRLEEM